jgi:hypothetical protein
MKCKEIKLLIPDILRQPGKYPEAEAHMAVCEDCRREFELIRDLRTGMLETFPESSVLENIPGRISAIRRLKRAETRRPLIYGIAVAATLILTLILAPLLQQQDTPYEFYTHYEDETLETMLALDLSQGMSISDEEIALYLIEHESLQNLKEISF